MNFNHGIPLPPLQQKDFEVQAPWAPVTPAKPAPGKRFVIPNNVDVINNGQRDVGSLDMNRLQPLNIAAGVYANFAQDDTDGRTDIYSCTDQLQDHCARDAASLASCNQFHGHRAGNYATHLSTSTFSNSIHGWEESSYMNLMASTHEAGVTKVPFYTPLMLSQIGEGLKMPVPQNLSVLNENVLLDHSLSNNSNNWTRTSQYGAFTPLISNSLSEGKMNMNHVMPCPPTPLTMENNKYVHGWLPNQTIDLEDYCRSKRNTYEQVGKHQGPIGKQAMVCLSTTLVPLEPAIPSFSAQVPFEAPIESQPQTTEAASAIVSSEKDIPQHLTIEEHINMETKGIDLNKTPRQKAKKKKHRPKVIREGKPKRIPKSTPPRSVTPKTPMNKEEKPSGKRKYVRKKKVQDPSENPSHVPVETADIRSISGTKSARRRLNFDLETVEVRDELPGSAVSVIRNEECRAPEVCFVEISKNSSTKLSLQPAQRTEIVLDNSSSGMQFTPIDGLMYQNTEHTMIPKETAPAYQVCREGTLKSGQMQNECEIVSEDSSRPSQQSNVGSIYKEYYELAGKSDHLMIANPEKSQKHAPAQLNSNQMLNLLLEMSKKKHNFSKDVPTPEEKDARVPHFHDVCHDGPYLPQGHKKQRREVDRNSFGPNAITSSVEAPPNDRRKGHVVLDNAGSLSFIKENEFMALEKQKIFDNISSSEQAKSKRGKQFLLPPERQSLISADHSVITRMDQNKSSDHVMSFMCNKIQEQRSCELQKYIDTQGDKANAKRKPRRRVHKEQSQTLSLSCAQVDMPTSENFGKKVQCTSNSSILECQSSSNYTESFGDTVNSGALMVKGDPLSHIIEKLKCLSINGAYEGYTHQTPYAIVPYNGGGIMVPYRGLDDLVKKRRTRPKVDLDPESNRVWNLLMGKQSTDVDEEMDIAKEKWWEEERRVFHGRVDSFIARMHLVQGDRRFSKWKGSVVDSVVGVFLTQNVSDHLSSSAFMALAARFPARCKNKETSAEKEDSCVEQESCSIYLDDTNKLKKQLLGRESYNCDSLVLMEENKTANVYESCGSNTGVCEDNKNVQSLHTNETVLEANRESPNSVSGIQDRLTRGKCAAETEDRWSAEYMASSQKSSFSSRNPSVNPDEAAHQRIDFCSSSSVEPENFAMRSLCSEINSSTSFTELLHIADRIPLMTYDGRTTWFSQVEARKSILDLQGDASGRNVFIRPNVSLGGLASPSMPHHIEGPSSSRLVEIETVNITSCHDIFSEHSNNDFELSDALSGHSANSTAKTNQLKFSLTAETASCGPTRSYCEQVTSSQKESWNTDKICLHDNLHIRKAESSITKSSNNCSHEQNQFSPEPMHSMKIQVESTHDGVNFQQTSFSNQQSIQSKHSKERTSLEVSQALGTNINDDACSSKMISSKMIAAETPKGKSKEKKTKVEKEKKTYEWDSLRRALHHNDTKKERSQDRMDSVDWEAVRRADVSKLSETIRERGMNNMLAERIKEFLDRLVRDHGSVDLEWLRDVEPDKAKDYLLSIRGLGLKSVECLRLLTLHHLAFPVDTNVGRICVRLGWVPLQPLPESLQLHLLELYPMLETIQKYLWPRLCKLDQRTLYELHYQLITFGKVFCTKSKPNCNACPMRGECKHFASAFASARLALPGPEVKDIVTSTGFRASENNCIPDFSSRSQPQIKEDGETQGRSLLNTCEPIIEEPATPENEGVYTEESAIEDAFYEDPDEIPTIKLNIEEFTLNLQNYIQENNKEIQDGDMSKALVAITQAASIPMPKLKNIRRLRTEHHVYQLPDSHPLLEGFDKREPDDPSPYLLAIWTPGETAQSTEPPEASCNSQETGNLCNKTTCFTCNSIREAQAQTVRATILIPCRTAMRGSFPLNGTYFQVNEVFADHDTSRNPIDVPRNWIWNLPRRTVYFGTSVPSIFKGLTTEEIQQCFWRGFVCVRGFDQTTRAPRPLYARLHFPASKVKNKKEAAAATTKAE